MLFRSIRNNQRITLPVYLATFKLELSLVVAFLTGLVFLGAGLFIGMNQPDVRGALLLGAAFICFGFLLMIGWAYADHATDLLSQLTNLGFCGALAFGFALWAEAKFYFPGERPAVIDKTWARRLPYLIAGAFFLSFSMFRFDLLSAGESAQILALVMVLSLIVLGAALPCFLTAEDTRGFRKIRRVLGSVTAGCGLLALLVAYLLFTRGDLHQLGYAALPLAFVPLVYLYTIGRYHLLEMNLGLSRRIQYVVITSVLGTVLFVALIRVLLFLPGLSIPVQIGRASCRERV